MIKGRLFIKWWLRQVAPGEKVESMLRTVHQIPNVLNLNVKVLKEIGRTTLLF